MLSKCVGGERLLLSVFLNYARGVETILQNYAHGVETILQRGDVAGGWSQTPTPWTSV